MKFFVLAALAGLVAAPAFAYQASPSELLLREHHDELRLRVLHNASLPHVHRHYASRPAPVVQSLAQTRSSGVPAGATAHCVDGTYSFSHHRSDTCSQNGGVAEWGWELD